MATSNDYDTATVSQHAFSYQPPPIDGEFLGKHIISVDQFQRRDLDILFDAATSIRKRIRTHDRGLTELCAGKVMASLFFEASTRTDMSFQSAMRRLGGDVIAVSNGVRFSSMYKGENLSDTIRATGCYSDVIVLRHSEIGSSYEAGYYLDLLNQRIDNPTVAISGGDGIGEHPTQALLDIFTIFDQKKSLDQLTISLVGDLKHGRTVHSLAKLIAYYDAANVRLCLVAPESLAMPSEITDLVKEHGIAVTQTDDLLDVIAETDVIYWTRIQEERFAADDEYDRIKDRFIMTPALLGQAKADAILMHPLPRKHEMGTRSDHDILDADRRSIYFEQMENGMFVRMALLVKVLRGVYV